MLKLLQTKLLAIRSRPVQKRAVTPPPPATPARPTPQPQPTYTQPAQPSPPTPPPVVLPPRPSSGKPGVALYDYDPRTDEEIAIKEGESLNVLDDSDPDWWAVRVNGKEGIVPRTYVELGGKKKEDGGVFFVRSKSAFRSAD